MLRIAHTLIIAILILALFATSYFVYRTVFTTIGQVDSILSLQSTLQVEPIDFNRLEEVEALWEEKNQMGDITITRDPFLGVPEAPTAETPTTTPVVVPDATFDL